jgi:hypothetical protein
MQQASRVACSTVSEVTPTPPLPSWIRTKIVPGYTNAHVRLGPTVTRLYGTENLYGDWAGPTLLLLKDFHPSRILDGRAHEPDPYRGSEPPAESITNRRLRRFLPLLGRGSGPAGFVYGSALANLLRDDGKTSGPLPNWDAARDYGVSVLREFVVPRMTRLDLIVCMGREAEEVVTVAAASDPAVARIRRVAVPHPGARWSYERHEAEWRRAAASIA